MTERYGTDEAWYTARLRKIESSGWRRPAQIPYRWNLRQLSPGFVLDVGCGLGRNLRHLDGFGVGVDHNAHSVMEAQSRGLAAFTPSDFMASEFARPGRFDSLLLSHVVEHMTFDEASDLLTVYLPFLRKHGRVIVIAPQEAGFRSDPTHVEYFDEARIASLLGEHHLEVDRSASFPFPRVAGRWFRHNEFVVTGSSVA